MMSIGEKEYWSERVLERIDRITKTNCHAQAKQQGVDIRDLVFIVYQRNSWLLSPNPRCCSTAGVIWHSGLGGRGVGGLWAMMQWIKNVLWWIMLDSWPSHWPSMPFRLALCTWEPTRSRWKGGEGVFRSFDLRFQVFGIWADKTMILGATK